MMNQRNVGKSLVFKASIRIMLIVIILLAVLILSYIYSMRVLTNNMLSSTQNTAVIYINNIENSLNSITKELNEISLKNLDKITGYKKLGDLDRYLASVQLREIFVIKLVNNENIDGLFVLQPDEGIFLSQFSSRITSDERMDLSSYLDSRNYYSNNSSDNAWNILRLDQTNYLIKKYMVSGIAVGALIKIDTLMSFIQKSSVNNDTIYMITDSKGNILSASNRSAYFKDLTAIPNSKPFERNFRSGYFVITSDISLFRGKLSCIIEGKNVFYGMEFIQWVIIVLGIASIFIIPYVLYYLFRGIIKPIRELVAATKEIEAGNWNFRLPRHNTPLEFITLNNSFESMVKEIKSLKINTYEEKIERQKAELKYLQMQIKPHFYLNAITTISSLTYQNKNEEIRTFIDLLSKHMRYMFKEGLAKVSIIEELEHARNYISMQEIKYPNNIFYMADIDPDLANCQLPQFLIQTFIENTFKHAFTIGTMLSIFIKVEKYTKENDLFVRIVIEDNGDGFPSEIINAVNDSDTDAGTSGIKIGINNIKKTLSLLYKRNDLLKISNCDPKGARVEILIPAG